MANQFGIDLGQVYRTTEDIKGARETRANNNTLMNWKKEDRETTRQRSQTLNKLRARVAAGGDDAALAKTELISFAPEEANQMFDAFKKMSDEQRQVAQDNIDKVGRISAFILNAQDPATAYAQARANVSPDIAANMPEQYDPNWVKMNLAKAREIDSMLKTPDKVTFGTEDRLYKDGQQVETAESNALAVKKAGGGTGKDTSASDEGLLYKQAAAFFGGMSDPQTGEMKNLLQSDVPKVQAIAAEASRLWNKGGISRNDAVSQAARKLGIQIQDLGTGGTIDRNQLLKQYTQ